MKDKITIEWNDISAILVALNVVLILCGWRYAPIFGLINNSVGLGLCIKDKTHFNLWIINISFIILNIYFLTI